MRVKWYQREQTTDDVKTSRFIPKNAIPIEEPGLGVCYVYPTKTARLPLCYGVVAYREKATHSDFHYIYKTDAEVDKKIAEFFDGIRQHKQTVSARRQREFAGHSYQVGDIVTNSWGYDQTNVDWYVVKRISRNYVWLKSVAAELIQSEGCAPMAGVESLRLDENLKPIESDKPETKHRASGNNVTMKHGCGSKWQGEKQYSSWYA